ncbi:phosphatase PAP2 family protein [Pseudarthrobacter sp. NamE2]|uniref:phosphatase PAP2 family protein n=1 Tax=Pseudarthrobacter sp. NamE2 TaxID=2576838 RepID=UPI0010FD8FC6|nr:phosphatase PAP2 family protein [Pseudarthrobacter sp. NamE2]TLM81735.1 phosphatase PAP2 family protein [Pseudarthrobacter sp. NamE2]
MTFSRQAQARTSARPAPGSGFLFVLATLACVAGLVATYYYFVQTTTGQFIDESALVEAVAIHGPAGKASTKFLDLLPTISLVMAAVVVLFVTVIRRRWTEAGIAVTACIGANIATQVLKDVLPARPDKGVVTLELNSLPSGHTTLAASAAAAVFLMASPRWRPMAGFVGGTFAIASGVSTLINQWHRPADVVAAFLLVGAFMIPAGWLIIRRGAWTAWNGFDHHIGSARIWVTLPVLLGLGSAAVAVFSLIRIAPSPWQETSTTNYFWAGISLIIIAGYLATVATTLMFAYAARRRDPPKR